MFKYLDVSGAANDKVSVPVPTTFLADSFTGLSTGCSSAASKQQ
jgi:hypothetical protein